MKNIVLYPIVLAGAVTLSACDSFLDQPAQGQMTAEDFLSNNDSAASLTNSIYAVYRDGSIYDHIGTWLGDMASDNALRGSQMSDGGGLVYNNGTNQFVNLSGLSGSSAFLNYQWSSAYKGIGRANTALVSLKSFEGMDERQREILEGEARFNRAWFYFHVLKHWGKGPIAPVEDQSGAEMADLEIATGQQLYDYIIEDCEAGLKMPDKNEAADWYSTSWYGRAHKGSAQGLLAKVLLYRASDDPANAQNYYRRIVEIVREMETSGLYGLCPVADRFVKEGEYSVESVFEIGVASFMTGDGSFQGWTAMGVRGVPNWGWGFIAPSLNLLKSYEEGDKRKENDIIYGETTIFSGMKQTPSVIAGTKITGAYSAAEPNSLVNGYPNRYSRKAWRPMAVNNVISNYGGNIRLMRWAEVLLIGAEAAFHTGDPKCREWYNAVRSRAGLGAKEPTLENIWEEKRIELCLEGDRYFDLVRIDKLQPGYLGERVWAKIQDELDGLAYMKAEGITPANTTLPLAPVPPVITPKHHVMPIPNDQILLMNNLKQNPDY